MKRSLLMLVIFGILVLNAVAEYQAFTYKATFDVPIAEMKKVDGEMKQVWKLKTVTLKGILVTVCCYPCQASFGKAYPSWLYAYSNNDKNTLWKIPVMADGGLFSGNASIDDITDIHKISRFDISEQNQRYVKRISKSWFMMNAEVKDDHKIFGIDALDLSLKHSGFGKAGYKIDPKHGEDIKFQPYIASINGNLNGVATLRSKFSYDPSNFSGYVKSPIVGSFSIKFSPSLTKLVAGTADWSEIDRRIFLQFKYDFLVEEEYDEILMEETCY